MSATDIPAVRSALLGGGVIPYLGPAVLALEPGNVAVPASQEALVKRLTATASVPHKIRNNLTAAAQFIENLKHRKTMVTLMNDAFSVPAQPTPLHHYLSALKQLPMIVDVWYDNAMATALADRVDWGQVQGLSQSEHFGRWTQAYNSAGTPVDNAEMEHWKTLLYKPQGWVALAKNYLVSDTDYVEVLTEIDIKSPIPTPVQQRRSGRSFLFIGCRFANQLERTLARQIMKRSSAKHWSVLPVPLTKNEQRFLVEQNIQRIDMPTAEFVAALTQSSEADCQQRLVNG